jgi:uncharacterized protein with HEPN domain
MPSTPSRSPAAALRDIVENIELARSFVDGLSFDVSSGPPDALRGRTVLEIISEASRRLPADLKARHPEIPWTDVAGAGSIYRHQYQNVRATLVWETVKQSLGPLRMAVDDELRGLTE